MITALQDVSNVSVVNVPPVRDRAALSGEVRPLPATPSAIVVLNAALQPPLTYDAAGRLESQVAQTTIAFAATQTSAAFTTPDAAQNTLSASATSFAQAGLAVTPTTPSIIANLASPPTVAAPLDLAVPPLPFVPGAADATPAVSLEPPVTVDFVAALSNTFNPVTPGTPAITPDITPLVTSGPGVTTTLTGVIADTASTLAGTPNTATFALPPPIAAAPPAAPLAAVEVEAAIPLATGADTFAPTGPTVAAGPATEGATTAAPLTPAALADTRIVTPQAVAATTPATARAEAVLTALNDSSANTVVAAPNVVGARAATNTDALASTVPAVPVAADAADAIAAPAAATTATATPAAPSVAGAAIPGAPDGPTVPAQVPTTFLEAAILTPDDIVRNPFYPAMAASLYLSAMTFRMQQSSAAELNSPAENVQMVGDVRAVSGADFDRQGPADDFRNRTRTFA